MFIGDKSRMMILNKFWKKLKCQKRWSSTWVMKTWLKLDFAGQYLLIRKFLAYFSLVYKFNGYHHFLIILFLIWIWSCCLMAAMFWKNYFQENLSSLWHLFLFDTCYTYFKIVLVFAQNEICFVWTVPQNVNEA